MSMSSYMNQLSEIPVSRERRKQPKDKASESEMTQFRSLAETLLRLRKGVLPPVAYVSYALKKRYGSFHTVSDLDKRENSLAKQ